MGKDARSGVPGLGLWGKTTSGTDFGGGGGDVVHGGLRLG